MPLKRVGHRCTEVSEGEEGRLAQAEETSTVAFGHRLEEGTRVACGFVSRIGIEGDEQGRPAMVQTTGNLTCVRLSL